MRPAKSSVATELVARLLVWGLVIFGIETYVSKYVRQFDNNPDLMFFACVIWASILFLIIAIYANSKLVARSIERHLFIDLLDIYLLDVLFQCAVWAAYPTLYDKDYASAGNCAIWVIKSIRLAWIFQTQDGLSFTRLPPIGPFGFFLRHEFTTPLGPLWQNITYYVAIVLAIPLGYQYRSNMDVNSLEFVIAVPLIIGLFIGNQLFFRFLRQQLTEANGNAALVAEIERLRAENSASPLKDQDFIQLQNLFQRLDQGGREEVFRLTRGLADFEVKQRRAAIRLATEGGQNIYCDTQSQGKGRP